MRTYAINISTTNLLTIMGGLAAKHSFEALTRLTRPHGPTRSVIENYQTVKSFIEPAMLSLITPLILSNNPYSKSKR